MQGAGATGSINLLTCTRLRRFCLGIASICKVTIMLIETIPIFRVTGILATLHVPIPDKSIPCIQTYSLSPTDVMPPCPRDPKLTNSTMSRRISGGQLCTKSPMLSASSDWPSLRNSSILACVDCDTDSGLHGCRSFWQDVHLSIRISTSCAEVLHSVSSKSHLLCELPVIIPVASSSLRPVLTLGVVSSSSTPSFVKPRVDQAENGPRRC